MSVSFNAGTLRLSTDGELLYGRLDQGDIQRMIDFLQSRGYIVIAPSHAEYCRYVSSQCPHCGQPVSEVPL